MGYSARNVTLYEPALDRLLMLDYEHFADERRIKEALAKLGIGSLVCYGQVWRKKRRRDGSRGDKRPRKDSS